MKQEAPLMGRTKTRVHSQEEMIRQREKAGLRDRGALGSISLYGQLAIGLSLYLYAEVSTPGYLSLLLLFPYLLLLLLLAWQLVRRTEPGRGVLVSALGEKCGRAMGCFLGLLAWLDGQMALYALCAVVSQILPTASLLLSALAIAAAMALALGGDGAAGLPRLARLMRWMLLIMLAACGIAALPHGHGGNFFPLLGYGLPSIFRGGLWMTGCAAGACFPLLLPGGAGELRLLSRKRRYALRPALSALALGCLTALLSACLMPVYALSRPATAGERLLMLSRISPSVVVWSLNVGAVLLVLLFALGAGVQRSGEMLAYAAGKKGQSPWLTALLLLSYVPCGALHTQAAEELLRAAAPLRGAGMLLALLLLWLGSLFRKRRETEGNEERA